MNGLLAMKMLDVARSVVTHIGTNPKKCSPNMDKERAIELRLQGLSYEKIGQELGVSNQRVHQVLTGYRPKPNAKLKERQRRYRSRWRKNHPDLVAQKNQQMAERRKLLVITHYGNGKAQCVKCGFTDIRALTLDHINACGFHNRRLAGQVLYSYLIKNNYPEGFQALCMNCQWIKRHENNEFGYGKGNKKKILVNFSLL